jgi:hypothetical protein
MRPDRGSTFADAAPVDRRGHRSRQTELLISERDRYLRAAADRFCIGMSDRQAATMLHTKLARYRSAGWRRDASEALPPPRHRGTITEYLWCVLKCRDHAPSEMTIRRALGYS